MGEELNEISRKIKEERDLFAQKNEPEVLKAGYGIQDELCEVICDIFDRQTCGLLLSILELRLVMAPSTALAKLKDGYKIDQPERERELNKKRKITLKIFGFKNVDLLLMLSQLNMEMNKKIQRHFTELGQDYLEQKIVDMPLYDLRQIYSELDEAFDSTFILLDADKRDKLLEDIINKLLEKFSLSSDQIKPILETKDVPQNSEVRT